MRKGIILAGGSGSRLYPMTLPVCKQLLPVYDKPMIYYGMAILMLSDIRNILIISTPKDIPRFRDLLGDGGELGIRLEYAVQDEPKGLAEAFIIGEEFIGNDPVCLILGDNIFFGSNLSEKLRTTSNQNKGATIFATTVHDPERYGIVEVGEEGKILSIEEKPVNPRSNLAVTGLYYFDNSVIEIAKKIYPSQRGELEITDVNRVYLEQGNLSLQVLGRGYAWLDAGTEQSLLDATNFVASIERRQGLRSGCIEEIAWRMGWIETSQLKELAGKLKPSGYGDYLEEVSRGNISI